MHDKLKGALYAGISVGLLLVLGLANPSLLIMLLIGLGAVIIIFKTLSIMPGGY